MQTDSMGPECRALSEYWDKVVQDFLVGGGVPPELTRWFDSYQGKGSGAVQASALPELFLGSLAKPKAVFLALNPGAAQLDFQGRQGIFAQEIREKYHGSYTAWAESWAYFRDPWVARMGKNRHHEARLRFLRDWYGDSTLPCNAMVSFEFYPWHSAKIDAPPNVLAAYPFIQKYVWKPIAELGVPVFAFGAPWFAILKCFPELKIIRELGRGGEPYPHQSPSRSIIVLQRPNCKNPLFVAKYQGGAKPPKPEEAIALRNALKDLYPSDT